MNIMGFDIREIVSAFVIIFAMIDILGSVPIILDLERKTGPVNTRRAILVSSGLLYAFLFAGTGMLAVFGVDIHSFAAAGAIILLCMATEMLTDREIFKYSASDASTSKSTAIVPVAFPLIAGAGTFTSLISLRAEYALINIIIALALNLLFVFFVLKNLRRVKNFVGEGGLLVMKRFFGIILMAIGVKMFSSNIAALLTIGNC